MKCGNRGWPRVTGCPRVARTSGWLLLLLIVCSRRCYSLAFDNTTDPFVQKCQTECSLRKDFASCGKYKAARWLNTWVKEKVGPICRKCRFVKLMREKDNRLYFTRHRCQKFWPHFCRAISVLAVFFFFLFCFYCKRHDFHDGFVKDSTSRIDVRWSMM